MVARPEALVRTAQAGGAGGSPCDAGDKGRRRGRFALRRERQEPAARAPSPAATYGGGKG